MAKANSKTQVFRGRKDKLREPTQAELSARMVRKFSHVPSQTRSQGNRFKDMLRNAKQAKKQVDLDKKNAKAIAKQERGMGKILALMDTLVQHKVLP